MVNELRDSLIAQFNMIIKELQKEGADAEEWEDGIHIETLGYMLNISIDMGVCIDCEVNRPLFNDQVCEECKVAPVIHLDKYRR